MKTLLLAVVVLSIGSSTTAQDVAGEARQLCRKVSEIKQIPKDRDEKGVDVAYDQIRSAGAALIPCLIEQITDTTVTHDPRCPHISGETKIGDVSYFLLVDLLEIDFTQFLPSNVKTEFKTNGVYAYHDYIEREGARKELQKKLQQYWDSIREKSG